MSRKSVVSLVVLIFLGTSLWTIGQGVVWRGTSEITNGRIIDATVIKDNFNWLKNRVDNHEGQITALLATTPPTCVGGNSALQWDGTQWMCQTIASATPRPAGCTVNATISLAHLESRVFFCVVSVASLRAS